MSTVQRLDEVWAMYCDQMMSTDTHAASSFADPANLDGFNGVRSNSEITLGAHVLLSILDTLPESVADDSSNLEALRVTCAKFRQLCEGEPHTAAAKV